MARLDLGRFFEPRSVAMIGVPSDKKRGGYFLFKKVRAKLERLGGTVYPVNPKFDDYDGVRCYPSVLDIPEEEIDLAIVMVGDVETALRQCGQKNVAYALIFTAGFSDTGPEGAAREAEIARIAAEGGVTIFGPNTNANAFEDFADLAGKKVALITQSGHQGRPIVQGEQLGIGFSHWAPTGNEVHLEAADFLEYFATLPDTGAIAMYVEGFKSGGKIRHALDVAARHAVPVVLVKVGRSEAGAKMALAHTGHLTGADRIVDAVLARYGAIRVTDLDEVLEIAGLFTRLPSPPCDGVCVYAISGGTGAHVADLFGAAGIRMPTLAEETQAQIRQFIPDYLQVSNPVDNGGQHIRSGENPRIMNAILADPAVGLLVIPITGILESMSVQLCTEIADAYEQAEKPVVVLWGSPLTDEGYRILCERRVPMVRGPRNGALAVKAFLDWHAFQKTYRSDADISVDRIDTSKYDVTAGPMSEQASRHVLAAAGVPLAPAELATSPTQARAAAERIGCPVVVKVSSPQIPHKSDAGLVRLAVASPAAAETAASELLAAARAAFPDADIEGVTVQQLIEGGVELIVGLSRDPTFGPVIAVGLGGVFAELYDDIALGLPPLDAAMVDGLLDQLKAAPLLDGYRGRGAVDRKAVVEAVLAVSRLAEDDRIAELDVNPLIATAEGAWAADALVVGRPASGR
jgi:acyl-CoA synthetase (NDP forming)